MSRVLGDDERRRVCAVCGRILNVYVSPEGRRAWLHTYADLPEDHPAVPVDLGDGIHPRPRCDFCDSEQPTWELPARSFILPGLSSGPVEDASHGNWAACDRCAQMIDRNQWNALRRRALAAWSDRADDPTQQTAVERQLGQLYRQLRRNITGPAHRSPPDPHP